MKIKENLDKIINVDNKDYVELVSLIDNFKFDSEKSVLKISELNSKYVFKFSNLLKKIFINKFENITLNINTIINFDAPSFFGIFMLSNSDNIREYIFKDSTHDHNKIDIIVELDYKIFKYLQSDTIAMVMIAEFVTNIFNDNAISFSQSILYKLSLDNLLINNTTINQYILDIFGPIYIGYRNSIIRIAKGEYNDKSDFLLPELYDIVDMINNQLPENILLYTTEEKLLCDNKSSVLDYIYNILTSNNGDPFLYKRLKFIESKTELKSIKNICNKYIKMLDDDYNITQLSKKFISPINSDLLTESFITKIKDSYKAKRVKSKLKSFNMVYDMYYNRFFELQIQYKHLKDEYNTLIFIRELNQIISILDEYLFDYGDKLSQISKNKMSELLESYKKLRFMTSKKDIPKYSRLGIWTPKEVKDNPYEIY